MTDNKFQIQTFAGGEIVPGLQVVDAVQNGTVECGHTALYYYFGKDDTFVFASGMPFGMNTRMQNAWMIQGGGLDLLNEFLKGYNCYCIPGGNTNCQMGGWFRKPIAKIDDLKGLKFRLGGFAGKIMQSVGASRSRSLPVISIPRSRKAPSTEPNGSVRMTTRSSAFTRSRSSITTPAGGSRARRRTFVANFDKWNALPKLYKEALTSACLEANSWVATKYDASNTAALEAPCRPGRACCSRSRRRSWTVATRPPRSCMPRSTKEPGLQEDLRQLQGVQDDGYLWHQVADYTMDSYMIRYRNQKS